MRYGLSVQLRVYGVEGDLADAVEPVVDHLASLEDTTPGLLDFGVGADASAQVVEVDLTIEASSMEQAVGLGLSSLRSAIHASGAGTAGWDDASAEDFVVIYAVDEDEGVEIRPLAPA